ncbi:hypothetical protein D3C73_1241930 [compost metagenome]
MRQVHERLDRTLNRQLADFIQQNRKDKRNQQVKNHLQHGNNQRVPDDLQTVLSFKQIPEIIKAYPLRTGDVQPWLIILKGHYNPAHRDKAEQNQQYHGRNQHYVELPVFS